MPVTRFDHPRSLHKLIAIAVGLMGFAATAHADSNSDTILVYSRNGEGAPRSCNWVNSTWQSTTSLPSVSDPPYWIISANCPTRNETVCATNGLLTALKFTTHNGTSWSGVSTPSGSISLTSLANRAYDMKYSPDGMLMLVYWEWLSARGAYRTSTGSGLSGEYSLSFSGLLYATWFRVAADPRTENMIAMGLGLGLFTQKLQARAWDGSSWGGVATLTSDATTLSSECFSVAYDRNGIARVIYGESGSNTPRYRYFDGSSWSGEASLPSAGASAPTQVKLVGDPQSDIMLLVTMNSNEQLHANVWNGTNWGADITFTNSAQYSDRQNFDVIFEPDGVKALCIYARNASNILRYRYWDGVAWSNEMDGPAASANLTVMSLAPGSSGSEIHGLVSDTSDNLKAVYWNGTTLSGMTSIGTNLQGSNQNLPFALTAGGQSSRPKIIRWREVPNPDPLNP